MALENPTYIADLVPTNPDGADSRTTSDDHHRIQKKAAKNTICGFLGGLAVTGTDGGAANAYTVTPTTNALPSYTARLSVVFSPTATNTGASTINVSGLGAKDIKRIDGSALVAGDLASGSIYAAIYNGTEFRLMAPTKNYIDQLALGTAYPASPSDTGKSLKYTGSGYAWAFAGINGYAAKTSNYTLVASDKEKLIDCASGTFTLSFTAAATLGESWAVYLRNSGTGDITLDPNGAETIDGLTSYLMYPGESRLVFCDGTAFYSVVLTGFYKSFPASGSFIKPPGYSAFEGLLWAAGGSGRKDSGANQKNGGGGGACAPFIYPASALSSTEAVTIGSGGAAVSADATNGNAGGNSTFKTVTAYGGSGGTSSGGAGGSSMVTGVAYATAPSLIGGDGSTASNLVYGGASSGAVTLGARTVYGGAGGGQISAADAITNVSTSAFGGQPVTPLLNSGVDGNAPGGGGAPTKTGAQSGAGARGEMRIWGLV